MAGGVLGTFFKLMLLISSHYVGRHLLHEKGSIILGTALALLQIKHASDDSYHLLGL